MHIILIPGFFTTTQILPLDYFSKESSSSIKTSAVPDFLAEKQRYRYLIWPRLKHRILFSAQINCKFGFFPLIKYFDPPSNTKEGSFANLIFLTTTLQLFSHSSSELPMMFNPIQYSLSFIAE